MKTASASINGMSWKNYSKSQIITINAVLCALVLIFVAFPIQIGILSLAVIPIIAIVISAETLGVLNGMITGLFFGLVSLIGQLIRPTVLSFAFYNPLVSILPRILIGVASYYAIRLCFKLFPKMPPVIANGIGAFCGVLTNTVGVLGMIMLFYYGRPLGSGGSAIGFPWLAGILVSNSILEAAVCTVLTPPLVMAVKKVCQISARKR